MSEVKYINGKTPMLNDSVVVALEDGTVLAGSVHQIYERNKTFRITGYALSIPANTAILAEDAYKAAVAPILAEREAAKKAAEAVKLAPTDPPAP